MNNFVFLLICLVIRCLLLITMPSASNAPGTEYLRIRLRLSSPTIIQTSINSGSPLEKHGLHFIQLQASTEVIGLVPAQS